MKQRREELDSWEIDRHPAASHLDSQPVRLSAYAYVLVSINLVMLFMLIASHIVSLRQVNDASSHYSQLVRDWLETKLEVTLRGGSPARDTRIPAFSTEIQEFVVSRLQNTRSELSGGLESLGSDLHAEWTRLEAHLKSVSSLSPARTEQFENALWLVGPGIDSVREIHGSIITTLSAFFGAVILATIGIVAFLGNEAAREHRQAVESSMLTRAVMRGQERERARISRALHDSLAQELAVALLQLGEGAGSDSESARSLKERLQSAIDWVRHLSHEIHPSGLKEFGLSMVLERYCKEVDGTKSVTFTWSIDPDTRRVSDDVAINVFRIAQEAVTNALRHSMAREVTLLAERDSEYLRLVVADDGVGLSSAPDGRLSAPGIGIAGMRERARMLGAELDVSEVPSGGTQVSLSVPVDADGQIGVDDTKTRSADLR